MDVSYSAYSTADTQSRSVFLFCHYSIKLRFSQVIIGFGRRWYVRYVLQSLLKHTQIISWHWYRLIVLLIYKKRTQENFWTNILTPGKRKYQMADIEALFDSLGAELIEREDSRIGVFLFNEVRVYRRSHLHPDTDKERGRNNIPKQKKMRCYHDEFNEN